MTWMLAKINKEEKKKAQREREKDWSYAMVAQFIEINYEQTT